MTAPWWLRVYGELARVGVAIFGIALLALVYNMGFAAGRGFECRMGFGAVEDYPARVEYCRERLR